MFRFLLVALLSLLSATAASKAPVSTGDAELDSIVTTLAGRDFAAKSDALTRLARSKQPARITFLQGILEARLQILKRDKTLVLLEKQGRKYAAKDALTGKDLGTHSRRAFKKLSINNALRGLLKQLIATADLDDPDPLVRLAAVQSMLAKPTPTLSAVIAERVPDESDKRVRASMEQVLALGLLASPDAEKRLEAINTLSQQLGGNVRSAISALATEDPDPKVQAAALQAVRQIDGRVEWYERVETLFFGLSLGSVLALAAFGLAITFGVMGVINMAHGELIMLGAYTAYLLQKALPEMTALALLLAVPVAFVFCGAAGMLLERTVIRFLYGRPLETLLATFGISLILQQLVRTVISPQNVPVANPAFMSGFIQVNEALSLTYNRLYIVVFAALVFVGLYLVMKHTRLGLEVRAVSQNRPMAIAMGIRAARVDALTFGLGSGIAGIAGVALSQLTNVGPNLGQAYIVDSFMVVVFGGVGNLWGTLIGALSLGIANKFLEPWAGAVMAKILVLVIVILFIQKRPRGLFPQRGRAAGD